MTNYIIAGIGPALVDFTLYLNSIQYKEAQRLLKLEPGGWCEINSIKVLEHIMQKIAGVDIYNLSLSRDIQFTAGSTTLGVFSAFCGSLRENSLIITPMGDSESELSHLSYQIYDRAVHDLKIKHLSIPTEGLNPLGLIFTSKREVDRILSVYKGCTFDAKLPEDIDTEYIYIDAYELTKGYIAHSIDSIIKSRKYKIFLGLSSTQILKGELRECIISYIQEGYLYGLVGNKFEFNQIVSINDFFNIRKCTLFDNVSYLLITLGKDGLIGIFRKFSYFQKAYEVPTTKIISTSGAGDIAAGVFISGIIASHNPLSILQHATFYASQVLLKQSNVFFEGIEGVKCNIEES